MKVPPAAPAVLPPLLPGAAAADAIKKPALGMLQDMCCCCCSCSRCCTFGDMPVPASSNQDTLPLLPGCCWLLVPPSPTPPVAAPPVVGSPNAAAARPLPLTLLSSEGAGPSLFPPASHSVTSPAAAAAAADCSKLLLLLLPLPLVNNRRSSLDALTADAVGVAAAEAAATAALLRLICTDSNPCCR